MKRSSRGDYVEMWYRGGFAPLKVLFAELGPLHQGIQAAFEERGWRASLLQEGEDLVSVLKQEPHDLLVVDLLAGSPDPAASMRAIHDAAPTLHVILATESGCAEQVVELLRLGVVDYVRKPLVPASLCRSIYRTAEGATKEQFERYLYQFVEEEKTSFSFPSSNLVRPIPLAIADRLLWSGKIDDRTRTKLTIAFQEAVTNALEHGNLELLSPWKEEYIEDGKDRFSVVKAKRLLDAAYSERRVFVDIEYSTSALRISVRDEGRGFIPDFSCNGDQLSSFGRGLTMIKGSMDEVTYSCNGRQITMVKYLPCHAVRREEGSIRLI